MRAPSLNKRMLLEAGWVRQRCAEPISAKCASCGSPIESEASDLANTEKDCWVCAARGIPVYACSRCARSVDCLTAKGERACESLAAFEGGSVPAFKPEGEIWFYRPSASGKVRVTNGDGLRRLFASGGLKPASQVCQAGGAGYVNASDHPAFAELFGTAPVLRVASPPRRDGRGVPPGIPGTVRGGSDSTSPPPVPATVEPEPPAILSFPATPPPASFQIWASLAVFLWGFISTGLSHLDSSLRSKGMLIGGFAILAIVSAILCFKIARSYVGASRTGGRVPLGYPVFSDSVVLRTCLFWSSMLFLIVFGISQWGSSGNLTRLLLVVGPISLPFIPGVRGALGSFALGCVFGFASLLAAAIPAGIASFFFVFDASKTLVPDAPPKLAAIGGFQPDQAIPTEDATPSDRWNRVMDGQFLSKDRPPAGAGPVGRTLGLPREPSFGRCAPLTRPGKPWTPQENLESENEIPFYRIESLPATSSGNQPTILRV
jgi:hypothetical protein